MTLGDGDWGDGGGTTRDGAVHAPAGREVALVDLLDRLLASGAVLTGEVTLAIADVDLVHISLRALITSISTVQQPSTGRVAMADRWVTAGGPS